MKGLPVLHKSGTVSFPISEKSTGSSRPENNPCRQKQEIFLFLGRLAALLLLLFLLFGLVFGITFMHDNSMIPRISAGDLLLYYRLDRNPSIGDVVIFEKDGTEYAGRVCAQEGDTVDITGDAILKINGSVAAESEIYYSTPQYEDGIEFPVLLGTDEYFILCDYREGAADSRLFGAVSKNEIRGTIITVIRRNDL